MQGMQEADVLTTAGIRNTREGRRWSKEDGMGEKGCVRQAGARQRGCEYVDVGGMWGHSDET